MIAAKLVVVGGDAQRAEVTLKTFPTIIGRAREATITIPHILVSRLHCEIFEQDQQLYVRDLNSTNGTYINREKIHGVALLPPNQLLTLGNVTFRAVYELNGLRDTDSVRPATETSATEDLQFDDTSDEGIINKRPDLALQNNYPHRNNSETCSADKQSQRNPGSTEQKYGHPENAYGFETDQLPVIEDEELAGTQKSICLAAIHFLPPAVPQASFVGGIESTGGTRDPDDTEAVHIDLGDDEKQNAQASQSALDSFFRKHPR